MLIDNPACACLVMSYQRFRVVLDARRKYAEFFPGRPVESFIATRNCRDRSELYVSARTALPHAATIAR